MKLRLNLHYPFKIFIFDFESDRIEIVDYIE